jgi:hypothetical protein
MENNKFTIMTYQKGGSVNTTTISPAPDGHYETSLNPSVVLRVDNADICLYRNGTDKDVRAPWIRIGRNGDFMSIREADAPKGLVAKKKKASTKKNKGKKKEGGSKKRKAEGAPGKEKPAKKAKASTKA